MVKSIKFKIKHLIWVIQKYDKIFDIINIGLSSSLIELFLLSINHINPLAFITIVSSIY